MFKIYFCVLTLTLTSINTNAALISESASINNKLNIDFTTSKLNMDDKNFMNSKEMIGMNSIAADHALKIKGKVTGITLGLNPLINNKDYNYFFTFNVEKNELRTKEEKNLNCLAIMTSDYSKYSAACYYVKH